MFRPRRIKRPRPVPKINKQICDRFLIPVYTVPYHVRWLDGTEHLWRYRAVQN
jgi:hypothetical protein